MALYQKTVEKVKNVFTDILSIQNEEAGNTEFISNYVLGIVYDIKKRSSLTYIEALTILKILENNGYLEPIYEGIKIVSLKILKSEWKGLPKEEVKEKKPKKKREPRPREPRQQKVILRQMIHPLQEKTPERCSILFVDWSNLAEGSLLNADEIINKLVKLEKTLVENGNTIEIKFVFVPEHHIETVKSLSLTYRYLIIACPRTFTDRNGYNPVFKDKDTTDALLTKLAKMFSLFSSKITHFILISGDADFIELGIDAKNHGKKFTVAAFPKKLSKKLEEIADDLILLQ